MKLPRRNFLHLAAGAACDGGNGCDDGERQGEGHEELERKHPQRCGECRFS
jgi:hypothetical protein